VATTTASPRATAVTTAADGPGPRAAHGDARFSPGTVPSAADPACTGPGSAVDAVVPGEGAGARGSTPNLFALRPATTANSDALREQAVARALGLTTVAVALCLVALVINLRFPVPAPGAEPRGPLAVASLAGGGLALLLDDALLLHARSGLPRRRVTAEALGLAALGAPLLSSADGTLLLRGRTADDPLWHLLRCRIDADVAQCSRVMPIPAPPAPLGLRESYLGDVLFLQLDDGRLLRRSPRGDIDGEAVVPRPLAPAPMLYREGLLVIPQPDTPLLGIHRSDSGEFGAQLDAVFLLTPAGTAPTRRIVDVAAVGDDRYALLEDEAGVRQLYHFDTNWGAPRRVALETEPAANAYLSSWRDRLLLASPTQRVQTRIAPGGRVEAAFESPILKDDHDAWKRATAQRDRIRRLGLIAPLLIAMLLLVLAGLKAAQARALRRYPPLRGGLLDPMPAGIRWLPPVEGQTRAAARLAMLTLGAILCAAIGAGLAGAGARVACLLPAFLAAMLGSAWLLRGCGGHLGRRDGDVIAVDHDGRYFYGREDQLRHGAGFLFAGAVAIPATLPGLGAVDPRAAPAAGTRIDVTTATGLLWHLAHPWVQALVLVFLGLLVSLGTWLLTA
jgi:hypothetical protein